MKRTEVNRTQTGNAVHKVVKVNVPQAHAFRVFTEELNSWWPLSTHKLGAKPAVTVILEPKVGGRWFERSADGDECDWGRVLIWDPPRRLVLAWEISADFKPDRAIHTEVEVQFVDDGPNLTTVYLEHRNLDQYADKAETMRSIFDSEDGWTGILNRFARVATTGSAI
jgi:uncharacterized protein YndB with AHSA1/START domain